MKKLLALLLAMTLALALTACSGQDDPVTISPPVTNADDPVVAPDDPVAPVDDAAAAPVDNSEAVGGDDPVVPATPYPDDWMPVEAFEYRVLSADEIERYYYLKDFQLADSIDVYMYHGGVSDNLPVEGIIIMGYDHSRNDTVMRIPDEIEGLPVLVIESVGYSYSFSDGHSLSSLGYDYTVSSIYVPDNVFYIGSRAFGSINSLSEIRLSSNLIYIGQEAFPMYASLTSIEIPDSVHWVWALNVLNSCIEVTSFPGHFREHLYLQEIMDYATGNHIEIIFRD